jgi:hypothetical protein
MDEFVGNNPTTGRAGPTLQGIGRFLGVVLLGLLLAACDSKRAGESEGRGEKNA